DSLRSKLFQDHPSFSGIGYIEKPANPNNLDVLPKKVNKALEDVPFENPICDFYMTNPILRASNVMAECSSLIDSLDMTKAAE
ncbi:MAG: NADH-quinone oxidoreductase subunit G, partial [Hellea sp.]|nr:NADH-quinone oxidoreductase subunit G [Hellea sp.]